MPEQVQNSAESSARPEGQISDLEAVRFRCLRNVAYHEDREAHYSFMHKLMLFAIVLTGATAFGDLTEVVPCLNPKVPIAIATICGLVDLVFDVSGKAKLHATLRWRCLDLFAATEENNCDISAINSSLAKLYADEPPTMHAVNALADNRAREALGRPAKDAYVVPFLKRLFRHWYRFTGSSFSVKGK